MVGVKDSYPRMLSKIFGPRTTMETQAAAQGPQVGVPDRRARRRPNEFRSGTARKAHPRHATHYDVEADLALVRMRAANSGGLKRLECLRGFRFEKG